METWLGDLFIFYFLCMNVLFKCMSVYHVHARCPLRVEEVMKVPGIGVTVGCETPRVFGNLTRSSPRAACALNHQAMSAFPVTFI